MFQYCFLCHIAESVKLHFMHVSLSLFNDLLVLSTGVYLCLSSGWTKQDSHVPKRPRGQTHRLETWAVLHVLYNLQEVIRGYTSKAHILLSISLSPLQAFEDFLKKKTKQKNNLSIIFFYLQLLIFINGWQRLRSSIMYYEEFWCSL